MMRVLLAVLFAFGVVLPADAQVVTFEILCDQLPAYQQPDGVEYVPGVDVHGKPVIAADLNAVDAIVSENIQIPITIELAEYFDINIPDGVDLDPDVAYLNVTRDGKVEYNGQDLSQKAYSVCGNKAVSVPVNEGAESDAAALPLPAESNTVPVQNPVAAPEQPAQPQGEIIEGQYP